MKTLQSARRVFMCSKLFSEKKQQLFSNTETLTFCSNDGAAECSL